MVRNVPALARRAQAVLALIPDLRPGFWFQPAVARSYQPFKCVQNPVTSPHTGELLKLFPQSRKS